MPERAVGNLRAVPEVPVAVSFMDVADFSEYTAAQGDEAAVALLDSFLAVAELFVKGARGRVVKRLGDGLMAAYETAEEAVRASVAIQLMLAARAAAAPGTSIPTARIGVHWGHAIERDGDLLGYDVNLAARLVEAAQPGQVVVTEAVKEALAPLLPGVRLRAVGRLVAKGVTEPVRVYEAEASSGAGDVAHPLVLPEGWVLAVDLFDPALGADVSEILRYAREAQAAVIGLGGRVLFLGVGSGEGVGRPRQLLSLIGFPSYDAFSAYVEDPALSHLAEWRRTVIADQDLLGFTPIPTLRFATPFGIMNAEPPEQDLPELPPVPFLLRQRGRRPRRR